MPIRPAVVALSVVAGLCAALAGCGTTSADSHGAARVPLALPDNLTGGVQPGNRLRNLLRVADAEWRRWGSPRVRVTRDGQYCAIVVSGDCEIIDDGCGKEQDVALCPVVDTFWTSVRQATGIRFAHDCSRTGVCEHRLPPGARPVDTPAWSAAFISTIMLRAGFAEGEFRPSPYHADYVVAARDGATSAYSVVASPAWVEPGDLVCTTRVSARVPVAPDRIDQLLPSTTTGGPTPMHCDLVVSVDLSRRVARAIGGNVMQSVALIEIDLDDAGRVSPAVNAARPWLLVMKLSPWIRAMN